MPEQKEIEKWVTIHGVHVPIFKDDTDDSVKNRLIAKQNEYKKQKEIVEQESYRGSYTGKSTTKQPVSPMILHLKDSWGNDNPQEAKVTKESKKYIEFTAGTTKYRLNKETGEVQDNTYHKVIKGLYVSTR